MPGPRLPYAARLRKEIADLQAKLQLAGKQHKEHVKQINILETKFHEAEEERDAAQEAVGRTNDQWRNIHASLETQLDEALGELHAKAVCDCHTWPTIKEFHEYAVAVEAERDAAIEQKKYAINLGLRMLKGYCEALTRAEAAEAQRDAWRACSAADERKVEAVQRELEAQRARAKALWTTLKELRYWIACQEPKIDEIHRRLIPAEAQEEVTDA